MKKALIILSIMGLATFGSFAQHPKNAKKHKHNTEVQVLKEDGTDPVCKMPISKGAKDVSVYKGKQVGFCSIVCKEMFDKNPKQYYK
jgi:YHS domain-containing protein